MANKSVVMLNVSDTDELRINKVNSNYAALATQRDNAIKDMISKGCNANGDISTAIRTQIKKECKEGGIIYKTIQSML